MVVLQFVVLLQHTMQKNLQYVCSCINNFLFLAFKVVVRTICKNLIVGISTDFFLITIFFNTVEDFLGNVIGNRLKIQGFIVSQYESEYPVGRKELVQWIKEVKKKSVFEHKLMVYTCQHCPEFSTYLLRFFH